MAQHARQANTQEQRTEFYMNTALRLHESGNTTQLCRFALYLARRCWQMNDLAMLRNLDYIAELLTNRLDEMPELSIVDFLNGGLEIGWLFNTISLLKIQRTYPFPAEDINEFIHGRLVMENSPNLSMTDGALGKGIYLLSCCDASLQRLEENMLPFIELHNSLVNIVEDMEKLLYETDFDGTVASLLNAPNEFLYMLLFLSRIIDLKIYPEIAKRILQDLFSSLLIHFNRMLITDTVAGSSDAFTGADVLLSSFDNREMLDCLAGFARKYAMPDCAKELAVLRTNQQLAERCMNNIRPADFINYLNHKDIKASGTLQLLAMPLSFSI